MSTKIFPDNVVAFVNGYKFIADSNSNGLKSLNYDVTLLTVTDSISFTSTVVCDKTFKPDSVSLGGSAKYAVEKLYVEPKGKKWTSRLRFYIPFNEFVSASNLDVAPTIVWYGDKSQYRFTISEKEWKKQRESWQFAIEIINENR